MDLENVSTTLLYAVQWCLAQSGNDSQREWCRLACRVLHYGTIRLSSHVYVTRSHVHFRGNTEEWQTTEVSPKINHLASNGHVPHSQLGSYSIVLAPWVVLNIAVQWGNALLSQFHVSQQCDAIQQCDMSQQCDAIQQCDMSQQCDAIQRCDMSQLCDASQQCDTNHMTQKWCRKGSCYSIQELKLCWAYI